MATTSRASSASGSLSGRYNSASEEAAARRAAETRVAELEALLGDNKRG